MTNVCDDPVRSVVMHGSLVANKGGEVVDVAHTRERDCYVAVVQCQRHRRFVGTRLLQTMVYLPKFFTRCTNQMIPYVSNAVALLLLSAYVTTLVADRPRWEFAVASIASTTLSFVSELHTRRILAYVWDTGIPFPIVYACVAYAGQVLVEFAVSYVTSSLILLWILVAGREGVVLYNADRASFVFTRCGLYAALRTVLVFMEQRWEWFTASRAHLTLLLIPTTESLIMWFWRDTSYRYDRSRTFGVTYALHKTSVFVVLPLLDEVIYAHIRTNLT